MIDIERNKALKRLKKILALSQSDNPGEAAAALHHAKIKVFAKSLSKPVKKIIVTRNE